jgi:hypothetical protein
MPRVAPPGLGRPLRGNPRTGAEVETVRVGAMAARAAASSRYGCSRHCRLVKRSEGSYLIKSAMHSINRGGTLRSKSWSMSFGCV